MTNKTVHIRKATTDNILCRPTGVVYAALPISITCPDCLQIYLKSLTAVNEENVVFKE